MNFLHLASYTLTEFYVMCEEGPNHTQLQTQISDEALVARSQISLLANASIDRSYNCYRRSHSTTNVVNRCASGKFHHDRIIYRVKKFAVKCRVTLAKRLISMNYANPRNFFPDFDISCLKPIYRVCVFFCQND